MSQLQGTPPINPFRSNKLSVTDTFYKCGLAGRGARKSLQKKRPRAQSKSCCILLSAVLPFFAILLLSLGTSDAQNRFSFGLSICYSARFLCGLPKAMLPVNVTPLCELAAGLHDHNPSSLNRYTAAPPDKAQKSSPITTTSSATPTPVKFHTNFASRGKGAFIIPGFTSPTHRLPPPTIFARIILALTGYATHYPDIMRPSTLLNEHVIDGECWEFSAVDGRVGVQLSQRINISHISLNYIHAEQLSPYATSKVPQDISIWGLVSDTTVSQIPAEIPVRKANYFLQKGSCLPSFINSSSHFVQLVRFRYNASSTPWQQFSIPSSLAQVSSVQTIVAAFETNKGASTTCVYTIGIYGVPT